MKLPNRPMLGIALLVIGLLISVDVRNSIRSYQGGVRQMEEVTPGPGYPFWMPISYEVMKVSDYLLRYLVIGVFTTTVGITIVAPSLLKRLAGIEDD